MSNLRIKKKHLNPDSVDGTKLKLLAGEAVRVIDNEGDTVDLVKLDINGNVIGNGFELAKKVDLEVEVSSRQAAVSAEESARIAGDLAEQSSRVAAIESEASARSAADEILLAGLDAETSARQAAVEAESSSRQVAVEAESSSRQVAVEAESSSRQAAVEAESSSRQAAVEAEESRALAAEATLQAAINSEVTSRQAAIADLINSAPEVLNTLKELADALGGDDDFATTIANRFFNIESSLSAATEEGTDYTDTKHQEILDLVSETLIKKEIVTISSNDVLNGFVSLSATDVIERSMIASIDRLSVFEDEDFTLSVVDGVTRMTFLNSFASGGNEAIEAGEQLRLVYWSLT